MSYRSDKSKTHRHEYTGSRRFSRGCRHGGSCGYCQGNRTHRNRRREPLVLPYEWSLTTGV